MGRFSAYNIYGGASLLITIVQPYKQTYMNTLDSLILAIISLVGMGRFSAYNIYGAFCKILKNTENACKILKIGIFILKDRRTAWRHCYINIVS
jgi:hypothetical protein